MKYLTLIRHAKSSWDDRSLKDHDRPLNERGRNQAPMMGRFIARTYLGTDGVNALLPMPDRLISSTAVRALTTAQLMQPALGVGSEIIAPEPRVYLAEPKTLLQVVREIPDHWNHIMIFGHNPGISEFAEDMLKRDLIEEMPTCAAVLLELPWDAWAAIDWKEARLIGYITPKLIEKRFPDGHEPKSGRSPLE